MRLPQLSYICIVMLRLKTLTILGSRAELASLPDGKLLINTVNAHSFNTAQKDSLFAEALQQGDVLIPDGVSIVKACKWIKAKSQPTERVAGWDLFAFEKDINRSLVKKSRKMPCICNYVILYFRCFENILM